MATVQTTPEVKQALLFMPDISGFTKFVNETEIMHGQQIVQELLEILLDSNEIKMQVNEIEGDAIFFYRPGQKPSVKELLRQVETMYINFHRRLQLYDLQKICNCGACELAAALKLKIIVHYGEIAQYAVKEHKKLFGKDVIIIHRLLKNNVDHDEYVLITHPLLKDQEPAQGPSWFSLNHASETYDAGEVQYAFSALAELKKQLPPAEAPKYHLSAATGVSFIDEDVIKAGMGDVFNAIFDLEQRPKWMAGVKAVEILNHEKINREGTKHRCIVDPKNNPIVITESARLGEGEIELVEMDSTGMGGCRYQLLQEKPDQTRVRVEVLVKKNPIVRLMFNMMMKAKLKKRIRQSLVNLKSFCTPRVEQAASLVAM
jgi:hypothetical protein